MSSLTHSNQSLLYVFYSWNFRHRLVRHWYSHSTKAHFPTYKSILSKKNTLDDGELGNGLLVLNLLDCLFRVGSADWPTLADKTEATLKRIAWIHGDWHFVDWQQTWKVRSLPLSDEATRPCTFNLLVAPTLIGDRSKLPCPVLSWIPFFLYWFYCWFCFKVFALTDFNCPSIRQKVVFGRPTCVLSFCLLALLGTSVDTTTQVSLHTLSVFASLCRSLFLVCFLHAVARYVQPHTYCRVRLRTEGRPPGLFVKSCRMQTNKASRPKSLFQTWVFNMQDFKSSLLKLDGCYGEVELGHTESRGWKVF